MFGNESLPAEELEQLRRVSAWVDEARPYLEVAHAISAEHVAQLENPDPDMIDQAYQRAVELVRNNYHETALDRLTTAQYDMIKEAEEAKIDEELRTTELPKIKAEAEQRFEQEGRQPAIEAIRKKIRAELSESVYKKVSEDRLKAIEAELRETAFEDLTSEANDSFNEKEEVHREAIRKKIAEEIAALTLEKRLATLEESERVKALQKTAQETRAKLDKESQESVEAARIENICEKAINSHRLDLADLKENELFIVALAYAADIQPSQVAKRQRILYFNVVDPEAGQVMLLRDNWQSSDDELKKSLSLDDGVVYEMGTVLKGTKNTSVQHFLHRSLPMTLVLDGQKVTDHAMIPRLEVSEIFLGSDLKTRAMISQLDRYGNKTGKSDPGNTDKDLFMLTSSKSALYRFNN